MIDRLTASPHFATFLGAFALALGVVCAVSLVVGLAVVMHWIVEVMG